jgi:phosphoglycolate phosphatase
MGFNAIIFDLDGTLLDTLEDLSDAVNRTLAGQGFPVHEINAYRFFVGDGIIKLISRALPESERTAETIHQCVEIFRTNYGQNWNRKTKPYPGIPDMLDTVVNRGLKLAVLSNKVHEFTEKLVMRLLPEWSFHAILGQKQNVPPKPDPVGALEIVRHLDLVPADFLYLGDSAVDMKTAVAAGMFPVGACWGFRTAEELQKSGCQALVYNPMELLNLLD